MSVGCDAVLRQFAVYLLHCTTRNFLYYETPMVVAIAVVSSCFASVFYFQFSFVQELIIPLYNRAS